VKCVRVFDIFDSIVLNIFMSVTNLSKTKMTKIWLHTQLTKQHATQDNPSKRAHSHKRESWIQSSKSIWFYAFFSKSQHVSRWVCGAGDRERDGHAGYSLSALPSSRSFYGEHLQFPMIQVVQVMLQSLSQVCFDWVMSVCFLASRLGHCIERWAAIGGGVSRLSSCSTTRSHTNDCSGSFGNKLTAKRTRTLLI